MEGSVTNTQNEDSKIDIVYGLDVSFADPSNKDGPSLPTIPSTTQIEPSIQIPIKKGSGGTEREDDSVVHVQQTTPTQSPVANSLEQIGASSQSKVSIVSTIAAFLCNIDFFISIFIYILCIFLGFVCILYGFGQITQLQLTNYWCEKKDLETIHQHSLENMLNEGTNDGCWKSKHFTVKYIMHTYLHITC